MTAAIKYENRIKSLQWDGLRFLWKDIEARISQPHSVLMQLLTQPHGRYNQSHLLAQLTSEDIQHLRSHPVIREIIQFLQSLQEVAMVV